MDTNLQIILIGAISTIVTGLIAWLGTKVGAWLDEKTNSSKISKYMELWKTAAVMAVSKVAQNYTDAVRDADGKLTAEQAHEALERAKALIKTEMSASAYLAIKEFISDTDAWIESLIEDAVRRDKLKFSEIGGDYLD